ncbi:centrosomal protein of 170 kDa-like isoform X2 [Brachyhypopomus gauderio]|uniref:centrosomal protein of 170 kDa-like isoform X2 n=1 Tax=Brachyhypopomus gauderio TaxID=698409 RepID=UPI0040417076
MPGDLAALHRGTPLYGQPSWWGDGDADDENSFKQENKVPGKKQETSGTDSKSEARRVEKAKENGLGPLGCEPSYFEIPSKDGHMAESSIHEVPTKDTEGQAATRPPAGGAAAQANTSFTIEFDSTAPGKVTIKDHVSRPRPKKPQAGGKELSTLQAAIMASESKVADWLAHNDPPQVRRQSTEEDSKSIKSDVPVHLKRLKGSKHEDGTQSDSENGLGLRFGSRRHAALEERLRAAGMQRAGPGQGSPAGGRTAFTIEFFDEENPRKRRSYSFSQTAPLAGGGPGEGLCPAPPSRPKTAASDVAKGGASTLATVAPTAARLLQKQRSEEGGAPRSSVRVGQPGPTEEHQKQDDDQSDKGTYTIELENHNPEEEEARRMIDKVFGVETSQEPGCLGQQQAIRKTKDSKKPGGSPAKDLVAESLAVGSSRWVSQWASLAANHTRTDPEGSGAEPVAFVHQERDTDALESMRSTSSATSSQTERKRTLPQLPTEERGRLGKASATAGPRSEIGEKQDTEPQEKESQGEHQGDGECAPAVRPGRTGPPQLAEPHARPPVGGEGVAEGGRGRRGEDRGRASDGERGGKALVRQGSFTIEKPSANVPAELIPRIGRRERRDSAGSMDTATLLKDTEAVMAFLEAKLRDEKKAEPAGVAGRPVSPETDVGGAAPGAGEAERKGVQKRRSLSSMHREKSGAGSAAKSAASARERLERKATKGKVTAECRPDPRRPPAPAGPRARQASLDLTDDEQTSSLPVSDVLSSDQETYSSRSHGRGTLASNDEPPHAKPDSAKSGRPTKPSVKASGADSRPSGAAVSKPVGLPQPRPTRASLLRRARLGEASDTDLADADRVSVASEVSTTSSTSKPPSGRKAPSRLDMLAQPRRTRLGSISARSDSEATAGRGAAAVRMSAETALRLGLRAPSPADGKLNPRMRANSVSKLTDAKGKVPTPASSATAENFYIVMSHPEPEDHLTEDEPMVGNRWRRVPPEYASTSEDEFGSTRISPKQGRVRPGTTLRASRLGGSAPVTPSLGGITLKHRMREQEDYIRDWTAHSEEIARISQDLAKDLAILAREIHDVAGEIDSVSSSGTAPSTTVSTAATTPGSAIDTREELVDRVFDESLNFRKIPPAVQTKAPEINGKPVELRPRAPDSVDPHALRRRTWNRDEVRPAVLDSLLLTSVSQLSSKIRQSVDKTAGKIRILFKDKDRKWDDLENTLTCESDVPLLKTSNKEISSILTELKRVEKQLQVINIMVDPDGTLDALTSLSLASPTTAKAKTSPRGPQPANGASVSASTVSPSRDPPSLGVDLRHPHPSAEASAITSK